MKKNNETVIKVRGQSIALTSILSRDGEKKKGKFSDQEAQVMAVLSNDRIFTSREIHYRMTRPPSDISSTRRAINTLKNRGMVYTYDRQKCKTTGKLVRRYQIQDLDYHNQLDLFAEKPTGKKTKYFIAIIDGEKILSFHIITAANQEAATAAFKKESLYSFTADQLMIISFSDLQNGFKWESLPF